jgi:lysophospholipase L1-like esterase
MAREARFGGAEVIICTYPMHRAGGFRAADPAVIAAYNRTLREVARGEAALLADFEADVPLGLVGVDGLHPTEEGYQRMAETLLGVIKAEYEVKR